MRLNFKRALLFVMERQVNVLHKVEGDRGGVTSKWGITLSTARRLGLDLDGDGDVDIDDLGLVTEEVIEEVFRKIAWDAVGGDLLPGGIDLIAADIAYNSFPKKFRQFVREGYGNSIEDLTARRKRFYNYQADNVPGQAKFRNGWLNRADLALEEAKKCEV